MHRCSRRALRALQWAFFYLCTFITLYAGYYAIHHRIELGDAQARSVAALALYGAALTSNDHANASLARVAGAARARRDSDSRDALRLDVRNSSRPLDAADFPPNWTT